MLSRPRKTRKPSCARRSNKASLLATDESFAYKGMKDYPHQSVHHEKSRYVIGAVHTNTIEVFWSIFKRGVVGTFHKMSESLHAAVRRRISILLQ